MVAWCGGGEHELGRLAALMRTIARRATDGPLWGKYRYRVVSQAADGRVDLQAVRKDAGLPDAKLVRQWPGVAGSALELAPGAEVLLEFIEGDPAQPIITAYTGRGGTGFVPTSITLGGETGNLAARQNDAVEVLLPPAMFTGSIGGSPASGVLSFTSNVALGVITGGSPKVKVAP
jgi:hypothetical protein